MSESFAEHRYYSLAPQVTPKTGQRILEAGMNLLRIPGRDADLAGAALLAQIPQPHHRTEPQAQHRRTLRPLTFRGLRFLSPDELLCVFEGVLDTPATGKSHDDLIGFERQVGGKKEVVAFFALGIAADHQKHRGLRDSIPNHLSGVDQAFLGFASFAPV